MNIKPVLGPVAVAAILFAGDALAGTSQGLSNVSVDVSTALLNDDSAVRGGVRKRIDDITVLPQEDVIDFGDDLSQWALDGECDDPRFVGAGMTWTPMLDEDAFHDASDCRAQFDRDMIALAVGEPVELLGVRFGDNSSQWSYDGECDDPRFEGAGMVHATPLDEDLYRDAGDCSDLYLDSMVELVALGAIPDDATVVEVMLYDGIDFGDDHSEWSLDGECDDPRFAGPGMTATLLLDEDTYHDATDCRDEYADGRLWFADDEVDVAVTDGGSSWTSSNNAGSSGSKNADATFGGTSLGFGYNDTTASSGSSSNTTTSVGSFDLAGIDFGDDRSQWSYDYECDDPRFTGPGMTATTLLQQDMYHDATDCHRAYLAGDIWMR